MAEDKKPSERFKGGDVVEVRGHVARGVAFVVRRDDVDRMGDSLEVGFQLGLEGIVQHDGLAINLR